MEQERHNLLLVIIPQLLEKLRLNAEQIAQMVRQGTNATIPDYISLYPAKIEIINVCNKLVQGRGWINGVMDASDIIDSGKFKATFQYIFENIDNPALGLAEDVDMAFEKESMPLINEVESDRLAEHLKNILVARLTGLNIDQAMLILETDYEKEWYNNATMFLYQISYYQGISFAVSHLLDRFECKDFIHSIETEYLKALRGWGNEQE